MLFNKFYMPTQPFEFAVELAAVKPQSKTHDSEETSVFFHIIDNGDGEVQHGLKQNEMCIILLLMMMCRWLDSAVHTNGTDSLRMLRLYFATNAF